MYFLCLMSIVNKHLDNCFGNRNRYYAIFNVKLCKDKKKTEIFIAHKF
jgi:hypothetical protein